MLIGLSLVYRGAAATTGTVPLMINLLNGVGTPFLTNAILSDSWLIESKALAMLRNATWKSLFSVCACAMSACKKAWFSVHPSIGTNVFFFSGQRRFSPKSVLPRSGVRVW